MSSDEATRPPTSIRASWPKIMPEGLIKKSLPLADSDPMIWVGFWSVIRLSAVDELLGWLNRTPALAPMLKLCQLAIIDWLD